MTALEAVAEMDAGPIWASVDFPMREAAKGSVYRNEVTEAAVQALLATLGAHGGPVLPSRAARLRRARRARPSASAHAPGRPCDRLVARRRATVLAKIHAADGVPGVLDEIRGVPVYLHDAHPEDALRGGRPGEVIARRDGAILRATVDGAVWIGHLRRKSDGEPTLKLPATMVLDEHLAGVPEVPATLWDERPTRTYRELRYEEADGVGYVHFAFYNGAMSTRQCERLAEAIRFAKSRPTRVIALMGGADFWSNGIHLNVIEASPTPADESWANINAIDDVALEILTCDRHLTVAAMQGNAGAGGVFLALAADRVLARRGVVLNPHYKGMGNLYGSEYWTYLLPRRVGAVARSGDHRQPLADRRAAGRRARTDRRSGRRRRTGVRRPRGACRAARWRATRARCARARKRATRAADEAAKPLAAYRAEELERMKLNFYGFDPSYHVARLPLRIQGAEVTHAAVPRPAPRRQGGAARAAA